MIMILPKTHRAGDRSGIGLMALRYKTRTFHAVGLRTRWKTGRNGTKLIQIRHRGSSKWLSVDRFTWDRMRHIGILQTMSEYGH